MYYIFNENGECVASCNYEPDADDLASRNEIAVVSEESYDIGKIEMTAHGEMLLLRDEDAHPCQHVQNAQHHRAPEWQE